VRAERRRERDEVPAPRPSLTRTVARLLRAYPRWGLLGGSLFLAPVLLGPYGPVAGAFWGALVAGLERGEQPWGAAVALAVCLLAAPVGLAGAFRTYPLWFSAVHLRLRLAVLRGQTAQRRLARTPPGEVVARALDSERMVLYADRWVDVVFSLVVVAITAALGGAALSAAVLGGILVLSALVSALGAPLAGSAAREAGDQRALLGRSLASTLDAARTVKLAAATGALRRHLEQVDARRTAASVREHRVRSLLLGVPGVLVQAGIVVAWAAHLVGAFDLETALLVTTTVGGFGWFGTVAGAAVTEAPVARRWLRATSELAGQADLVRLPPDVDLVQGVAPPPPDAPREPLRRLVLEGVTAVHDDGTVGVEDVDLTVDRGDLVLLAGRVGSGKSSLLSSLAGLVDHEGTVRWNDRPVADPQLFLRPGQVAYVGQVPRVLSGTFLDNVALDHARDVGAPLEAARMGPDVDAAGGHGALVGHRGVRLSGGQVQRLALARALATGAELLVADDVSSALDARTEVELWESLRARGTTVVGSSSKRSALERADVVVVLDEGRVAATGRWEELAGDWGHLAG
jgi:ABC-type multidrug transport system fused ATPase/permease subunit